jgi:hypothetical protein
MRTLYRSKELAVLLNVSAGTITRWRQRGWIVGYRLSNSWYYDVREVEQTIRANSSRH